MYSQLKFENYSRVNEFELNAIFHVHNKHDTFRRTRLGMYANEIVLKLKSLILIYNSCIPKKANKGKIHPL